MFGSDWPVCLLAASYEQVMQAMRHATSDLSPAEKEAVFGGNALRVYGLTA
jgi:L-fuconolactonase